MNAIEKGYLNIVRLLLLYNPNIKFEGNVTPLMLAARYGHTNIVNFLLENGANINDQDKDGVTALMFAVIFNHINIVTLLLLNQDVDPTITNKLGRDISQFVDQYYGQIKSNEQKYFMLKNRIFNCKQRKQRKPRNQRNNTASLMPISSSATQDNDP